MIKNIITNRTRLQNEEGNYQSIYSSVSNVLLVARNHEIQVINSQNLAIIKKLEKKQPGSFIPPTMFFLEDGKSFICWDHRGSIDLWQIESEQSEELINKTLLNDFTEGAVLALNNNILIVRVENYAFTEQRHQSPTKLLFIDIQSKAVLKQRQLKCNYYDVILVDDYLVCGSNLKRCIDVYTMNHEKRIKHIDTGFDIYKVKLITDKNNKKILIASGFDASVHFYDFESGVKLRKIVTSNQQINNFYITSDGRYIFILEYNNQFVSLYQFNDGKFMQSVATGLLALDVYFNEQDKTLLIVDHDGVSKMDCHPTPSLINLCVNVLQTNVSFFANKKLTEKQVQVLKQYFVVEEDKDEAVNAVQSTSL